MNVNLLWTSEFYSRISFRFPHRFWLIRRNSKRMVSLMSLGIDKYFYWALYELNIPLKYDLIQNVYESLLIINICAKNFQAKSLQ